MCGFCGRRDQFVKLRPWTMGEGQKCSKVTNQNGGLGACTVRLGQRLSSVECKSRLDQNSSNEQRGLTHVPSVETSHQNTKQLDLLQVIKRLVRQFPWGADSCRVLSSIILWTGAVRLTFQFDKTRLCASTRLLRQVKIIWSCVVEPIIMMTICIAHLI